MAIYRQSHTMYYIYLNMSINQKNLLLSVTSNNKTQYLVGDEECALLTIGVHTLENESRQEAQYVDY